ncbi:MAG TPA: tRNA lysidine(34) synthetase TilS [Candidatus Acidoferrum sp.]|nr:tRNA lysidine(34) synthetase TilS [Candidatus Acidoferrum sp.]
MLKMDSFSPGRYVVAVSGGVDSMALLHLLSRQPQLDLIVAHFDHGIRVDSQEDQSLVEQFAMSHNLTFICEMGKLGSDTSEALARTARYNFLDRVCKNYNALAIITAHHQDDLLETALINLLRGTGRRGLTALRDHDTLRRPLLGVSKAELLNYAVANQLPWREDSTNTDQKYLRNFVRHQLLAPAGQQARQELLKIIVRQSELNDQIDQELDNQLGWFSNVSEGRCLLYRHYFIMSPTDVALEVLQHVLKAQIGSTLERPFARRALLFIKAARTHKRLVLPGGWQLYARKNTVIVCSPLNMVS